MYDCGLRFYTLYSYLCAGWFRPKNPSSRQRLYIVALAWTSKNLNTWWFPVWSGCVFYHDSDFFPPLFFKKSPGTWTLWFEGWGQWTKISVWKWHTGNSYAFPRTRPPRTAYAQGSLNATDCWLSLQVEGPTLFLCLWKKLWTLSSPWGWSSLGKCP